MRRAIPRQAHYMPLLALGFGLLACGGGRTEYDLAMDAGEKARRQKNPSAEQGSFERAAALAEDDDERSEALYRAAHAQLRAGNIEQGANRLEELAKKYPTSARAARAWLDAGRVWEKLERNTRAINAYEVVWRKYPDAGGAITAAKQAVLLMPGSDASTKWKSILERNHSDALRPAVLYELGISLEETSPREAIAVFEEIAKLEPLPLGSYTDEALLHAAKLRRAAGDFTGALDTLQLLTVHGGDAAIVGSYNRPAYVEGLLLQGRILRDDLMNKQEAIKVFLQVSERFPDSRLVDDALWEAAITEHLAHGNACEAISRLRAVRPQSKFLRCSAKLCPDKAQPIPSDCPQ